MEKSYLNNKLVEMTSISDSNLNINKINNELTSSISFPIRPLSAISDSTFLSSPSSISSSSSGNVKVVVRVRPLIDREIKNNSKCKIRVNPLENKVSISNNYNQPALDKEFFFDNVLDSSDLNSDYFAGQDQLYESVGKPFLNHNLEGYNTCIFAYGQTGSGKTYTMMGTNSEPGLIPLTCHDLFSQINELTSSTDSFVVRLSYFEIYNEKVRDLLSLNNNNKNFIRPNLQVRESPTNGPYVKDLIEYTVKNYDEVKKYIELGNQSRATAFTKMNETSSRSHAVLTLTVKHSQNDPETDETKEIFAKIRLVDLAGSERAHSTGATGSRLREGASINKSLATLGRVISALANPKRKKEVIPYRDSTLTWILKESLGGNSQTAMIACLSPTDYDEGLSTLRYAVQAKRVKTRAIVNCDLISALQRDNLLQEMQNRIHMLQSTLLQVSESNNSKSLNNLNNSINKNNSNTNINNNDNHEELEKFKSAIQYYEDKSVSEELRRKAVQSENEALRRHNELMKEHIKTSLNGILGKENIQSEHNQKNDIYLDLKLEQDNLLEDIKSFKLKLRKRPFENSNDNITNLQKLLVV